MGRGKGVPDWAKQPSNPGRFILRIRKEDAEHTLPIDELPGYLIGRNKKECDILCEDKTCSRVHACIAHHSSGAVYIVDLESVHGTAVNGRELKPGSRAELRPGASFTVGDCPWTYRIDQALREAAVGRQAEHSAHANEGHASTREDRRGYREERHRADTRESHRTQGRESERIFRCPDSRSLKRRRHDDPGRVHREGTGDGRKERRDQRDQIPLPPRHHEAGSGFSARDPASVVRSMAGPPPSAAPFTSLDQKKKLLWAGKSSGECSAAGQAAFGANRWDSATFESAADQQKFNKLMGVHSDAPHGPLPEVDSLAPERQGVLAGQKQVKVLGDVETHFMQGLRRADGRKVGLGL